MCNMSSLFYPDSKFPIYISYAHEKAKLRQLASGPKPNYTALMSDLETRGFLPNLDTLEIGSLGHFEKRSYNPIRHSPKFDKNNLMPFTSTLPRF